MMCQINVLWLNKISTLRYPTDQTNWYIPITIIQAFLVTVLSIDVTQLYIFKIILIPSYFSQKKIKRHSLLERVCFTLDYLHSF